MSSISSDETLAMVREVFEEQIPFNKVLGLTISELGFDRAEIRFEMRETLVGNFVRGILHGGVISAVLDVTGGLLSFASQFEESGELGASNEAKLAKLARTGTIDLRVDYLRPGEGKQFVAKGFVLRRGARVVVARMELLNEREDLIAVGTGAYSVSG